jgi:hypothetical protein
METPQQNKENAGDVLLQWTGKPYAVHERTKDWYVKAGVVTVLVGVYAVLTASWTFAIVILLAAGVFYLLRDHEPREQTIEILRGGIRLQGVFRHWKSFKGFFLKITPNHTELHVLPISWREYPIMLHTGNADVREIRRIVSEHIPQLSDREESLLDSFIRFCKL